jgi:hypothetical protein
MKSIRFKVESSYGMLRAYPLDQEAILICRLSKTKTLLPGDIGTCAALGYEPVNQYGIKIDPRELV